MPFSAARVDVSHTRERAVPDERRQRVDLCFQMPVPTQHEEVRDVDGSLRLLAPPRRLELVQLTDVCSTTAGSRASHRVPVRGGRSASSSMRRVRSSPISGARMSPGAAEAGA